MKRFFVLLLSAATGLVLSGLRLTAQQPGSTSQASVLPVADGDCRPPTCTICVSEPKHTTKTVFACKREEYCLPRCSFFPLLWGACGCDEGRCGVVKVRHRLVVKKVEGCDTKQCILREVPLECLPHGAAGPMR